MVTTPKIMDAYWLLDQTSASQSLPDSLEVMPGSPCLQPNGSFAGLAREGMETILLALKEP